MRVAFVGLMLAGCQGLLGLDETVDAKFDADLDQVDDRHDNCLGVANPEQADLDDDGLGDICDPTPDGLSCAIGMRTGLDANGDLVDDGCQNCAAAENEDGDGVTDQCDPCPAIRNEGVDTDQDLIGDGCDPSANPHRRIAFDGFNGTGAVSDRWQPNPGWLLKDGAVTSSGTNLLLREQVYAEVTGDFAITTTFEIPESMDKGVGLVAVAFDGDYFCGIENTAQGVALFLLGSNGEKDSRPIPNQGAIDLRMTITGAVKLALLCQVLGDPMPTTLNLRVATPMLFVGLRGEIPTRFPYVDVISR